MDATKKFEGDWKDWYGDRPQTPAQSKKSGTRKVLILTPVILTVVGLAAVFGWLILNRSDRESPVSAYTVSFEASGGDYRYTAHALPENGHIVETPPTPPQRDKYNFTGWFLPDGRKAEFPYEATGDIVLLAGWTPVLYMISFDADGATDSYTFVPADRPTVYELPRPYAQGKQFAGFYYDPEFADAVDLPINISDNLTLYCRLLSPDAESTFNYSRNADQRTVTITSYSGTREDVVIPETLGGLPVTGIGDSAFEDKNFIKSVFVPNGVKRVGDYAFANAGALTRVELPSSVTEVSDTAFEGCPNLRELIISRNGLAGSYNPA